jgi:hypothetical protein
MGRAGWFRVAARRARFPAAAPLAAGEGGSATAFHADDLGLETEFRVHIHQEDAVAVPSNLIPSHITMPPKKPAGNVVQAEVALKQSLKNCLVNLPSTLVSVLVNANAVRVCAGVMRRIVD